MNKKIFAFAVAGIAVASTGATAQTYGIGSNPQGSIFFATAAAVSKVMVQKTGQQFRVQPYAGSSTYMPLVSMGKLAFGVANAGEAHFAHAGIEVYKRPNPNLRQVAFTFGLNSGWGVRTDSKMKTIADLKGAKAPVDFTSGRIFHYLSSMSLATADLTASDLKGVPTPNFVTGIKAFMAGRLDAAYFPLGAGIAKQAMATIKGGWRYLKMDCSKEAELKLQKIIKPGFIGKAKPGPKATGVVNNPQCLVNVPVTVVAGKHVSDKVVYSVVKTMHAGKKDLAKALGAFNRFNPKEMARAHPTPYHPGAIKAYKELGIWPGK
jgi:TRAP transporter TAXI family solute receptor